jgi:hypothetical protein
MKRLLAFVLIAVLSLSAVIAATQVLPNLVEQAIAKPMAVQPNPDITKATITHLITGKKPKTQPVVQRAVIAGKYAIATWQWGETAGQSILSQQGQRWKVISSGGGAINLDTLKQKKVPIQIAEQLMQKEQAARKR